MATRTSHSSPCFLRVADASAASSASKITSLSTPFSLETASTTIRISLFTVPRTSLTRERPSGRKPRLANLRKPHRHALAVDLERDAALVHRQQRSGVAPPPGARLPELDEHPGADEAPEVRPGAQQPVESRRGHLQRVGGRDRVLDVEERGHLAADALAVIEPDARLRVDVEPQERAAVARGVIELDELVPEPREQRLEQRPQALAQLHRDRLHRIRSRPSQCRKQKKGPKAHRKTKSPAGGFRSYLILGGAALSRPLRRATPAHRPQAAARYLQVKDFILERIAGGALRAGERVPSENELTRTLTVSRMTANRALRELAADGVLIRVAGVGTFVAEQRVHAHPLEVRNI